MKLHLSMGILAALLIAADAPKEDAGKQDLKKLQGSWTQAPADSDKGIGMSNGARTDVCQKLFFKTLKVRCDKYVFDQTKLTCYAGKEKTSEVQIKLDASKKPKEIDITIGKDSFLGIYELKDNVLTICISAPVPLPGNKSTRPTSFDVRKQDGLLSFAIKRAK
jgi:uncharacterized protein (TIGR03067 family)